MNHILLVEDDLSLIDGLEFSLHILSRSFLFAAGFMGAWKFSQRKE